MTDEQAPLQIRWWLHVTLGLWAFATMWAAGLVLAGGRIFEAETWHNTSQLGQATAYAVCTMAILMAHELGHYLQARRHGVEVTPPYFLPGVGPLPWFEGAVLPMMGTFGAFIGMELKPMRARSLMQIGAWGPIAGFIVTLPVLVAGYAMSSVKPLVPSAGGEGGIQLGDSLVLWACQQAFFPEVPAGHDVFLHPVAMAGWTGCFLTAFNLLPLGQLDGGHVAYCVLGERFNRAAPYLFWGLVGLGLVAFPGWLVLAMLVYRMGATHPPLLEDGVATGRGERALALICLALFVCTITPRPFIVPSLLEQAVVWALGASGG